MSETSTTPRFANIKPGQSVKVHQKIKELNAKGEEKERIQIFEGLVLARHGGLGINSTITVRKVSGGIGVERIFPLHLPTISNIEIVKTYKTKRAKLYFAKNYNRKLKEIK